MRMEILHAFTCATTSVLFGGAALTTEPSWAFATASIVWIACAVGWMTLGARQERRARELNEETRELRQRRWVAEMEARRLRSEAEKRN